MVRFGHDLIMLIVMSLLLQAGCTKSDIVVAPTTQKSKTDEKHSDAIQTAVSAAELCCNYTNLETAVVYEDHPEKSELLMQRGLGYRRIDPEKWAIPPVANAWPVELTNYDDSIFVAYKNKRMWHGDTICYMHRRQSANGTNRLVIVELESTPNRDARTIALYVRRIDPPTLSNRVSEKLLQIGERMHISLGDRTEGSLTVFAGQSDKLDSSHFTIAYEVNGKSARVHGWLTDADFVEFSSESSELPKAVQFSKW